MAQDPAPENAESIILDYISEHPGADAEEIAEANYIKIAFVEHHLKSLKKRHAVHSRMSGKVRRYYPIAAIDPPEPPIDDTVPPLSENDCPEGLDPRKCGKNGTVLAERGHCSSYCPIWRKARADPDPLTEEEERDVAISLQELKDGKIIEMRPDETVEEFLDRQCDGPSCTVPESKTALDELCSLAKAIETLCIGHGYDCRVDLTNDPLATPMSITIARRRVTV